MAKKNKKRAENVREENKTDKVKKTKIKLIGIGGGGGNIVSELSFKVKKAAFVAANTDSQALKGVSRKVERFLFGQNLTKGLGTGMNVELAETAAESEKEKIKKILQGQDLIILVATLGGGAGSAAISTFARISKSLGNMTYGIFTLPFKFEGEKKAEIARNAIEKVRPKLNALSVIPNERIFQIIDKSTPLQQAFSIINKNLAYSLEGLLETIYEPGLINIDFADLRTVLQGQGRLTYLNTVEVLRKDGSAKEAIEKVINSPLYPYGIKGAKGVLLNIAGEKGLPLSEVTQISRTISDQAKKDAKIIFGITQGKQYHDIIKTTLLATGCVMKIFPTTAKKKKSIKKPIKKKIIKKKKRKIRAIKKKKRSFQKKKIKRIKKKQSSEKLISRLNIFKKKNKKRNIKKNKGNLLKIKFLEKELPSPTEQEIKEENQPIIVNPASQYQNFNAEPKIRKNALQIRKEAEATEKEILEQEKIWETPSFLKRRTEKS